MTENAVQIRAFSGLNTVSPPSLLPDTELSRLTNMVIGRGGELRRRSGFQLVDTSAGAYVTKLLGIHQASLGSYVWVYHYNGTLWTQASQPGSSGTNRGALTTAHCGLQYSDDYYVAGGTSGIYRRQAAGFSSVAGAPSTSTMAIFKDRLFAAYHFTTATASRLYFSAIADPTSWPGANFLDVSEGDGEQIIAIVPYQDRLLIFKTRSIYALYIQGEPSTWVLRPVTKEHGARSARAIVEANGSLYFRTIGGIYRTDGVGFIEISAPISNLFYEDEVPQQSTFQEDAGFYDNGILWALADGSYYHLNLDNHSWSEWIMGDGDEDIEPWFFVNSDQDSNSLWTGSRKADGKFFNYGLRDGGILDAWKDDGVSYVSRVVTKEFDFGSPERFKRGKVLLLESKGAGETVVTYNTEAAGEIAQPADEGSDDFLTMLGFSGPGYFRTCSVEITNSNEGEFYIAGLTFLIHLKRKFTG